MEKEKFSCKRDGLTIRGIICRGEEKKKDRSPVIIISHGFTCNMYSCMGYCEKLCDEGYVCVLFSFCGGGNKYDSEEVKSEGSSVDMTISSEVADLEAVVGYVSSLKEIDTDRIILMGESQGGYVSGLVAADLREKVYKLIMVFPALCIPDHARQGQLAFAHYDPESMPEFIDVGATIIGKKLHDDVVDRNPYLEIARYKRPVLIIHGDEDKVVNYAYSVRAQSAYGEGQCSLKIMRNMGHGVDEKHFAAVMTSIIQFLNDAKQFVEYE